MALSPCTERSRAGTSGSWDLTYLAKLQELPVMVDKGQDFLKVKVPLLALYSQVIEGQVNYIHPG